MIIFKKNEQKIKVLRIMSSEMSLMVFDKSKRFTILYRYFCILSSLLFAYCFCGSHRINYTENYDYRRHAQQNGWINFFRKQVPCIVTVLLKMYPLPTHLYIGTRENDNGVIFLKNVSYKTITYTNLTSIMKGTIVKQRLRLVSEIQRP